VVSVERYNYKHDRFGTPLLPRPPPRTQSPPTRTASTDGM